MLEVNVQGSKEIPGRKVPSMNKSLRMRLGAVVLALLTLAAVIFSVLNFQQRSRFIQPDDGVTWVDVSQPAGVTALHVVPGSPADRAGIRQGDSVESVRGVRDRESDRRHAGDLARRDRGRKCITRSGGTGTRWMFR